MDFNIGEEDLELLAIMYVLSDIDAMSKSPNKRYDIEKAYYIALSGFDVLSLKTYEQECFICDHLFKVMKDKTRGPLARELAIDFFKGRDLSDSPKVINEISDIFLDRDASENIRKKSGEALILSLPTDEFKQIISKYCENIPETEVDEDNILSSSNREAVVIGEVLQKAKYLDNISNFRDLCFILCKSNNQFVRYSSLSQLKLASFGYNDLPFEVLSGQVSLQEFNAKNNDAKPRKADMVDYDKQAQELVLKIYQDESEHELFRDCAQHHIIENLEHFDDEFALVLLQHIDDFKSDKFLNHDRYDAMNAFERKHGKKQPKLNQIKDDGKDKLEP